MYLLIGMGVIVGDAFIVEYRVPACRMGQEILHLFRKAEGVDFRNEFVPLSRVVQFHNGRAIPFRLVYRGFYLTGIILRVGFLLLIVIVPTVIG